MDMIDQLRTLAKKLETKETIPNEEATKMTLVAPLINMLGYDVFDHNEVTPEYSPDYDIKKAEKVDYAIIQAGKPIMLIEAKSCHEVLEKYTPQLFKYYAASCAKIGILTNGIAYQFYCDLDKENLLDKEPFFVFDLSSFNEASVEELKKFRKEHFDVSTIQDYAHVLRYQRLIKDYMQKQLTAPDPDFVQFIIKKIDVELKRFIMKDDYNVIVKNALNQFISSRVEAIIKNAMKQNSEDKEQVILPDVETSTPAEVDTTDSELAFYNIIKGLLAETVDTNRVTYHDTKTYFSITIDNKVTKWICRIQLQNKGYKIEFPAKYNVVERFKDEAEIIRFKETIRQVVLDMIQ